MDNNDLLRRLRYALRCDDAKTSVLIQQGGGEARTAQVARWRAKEEEDDYESCETKHIEAFLGGLIIEYRGEKEEPKASPWPDRSSGKDKASGTDVANSDAKSVQSSEVSEAKPEQIDNNVVLKQLRIALSLRSDDVHAILKSGGSALSASEAGALFRKPDARNYRKCGDQVLRQFIAGLVKRRENESEDEA